MRAAMRAVLDGKQVAVLAHQRRLPALEDVPQALRSLPGHDRNDLRSAREGDEGRPSPGWRRGEWTSSSHHRLSRRRRLPGLGSSWWTRSSGSASGQGEAQAHKTTWMPHPFRDAIPRTLQMGLSGIREHVGDRTPPATGSPSRPRSSSLDRRHRGRGTAGASREGQIFFVTTGSSRSTPWPASSTPGPGGAGRRRPRADAEAELERVMLAFVEGGRTSSWRPRSSRTASTSRGQHAARERADRYGLAQLYQLRGRVAAPTGAPTRNLLVPRTRSSPRSPGSDWPPSASSPTSEPASASPPSTSSCGGPATSSRPAERAHPGGGLDLYVKLLEQAILDLRGEPPREAPRAALHLRMEMRIPPGYVPETHQRLSIYKRVSQVRSETRSDRCAPSSGTAMARSPQRWRAFCATPRCACARRRSR